MTMLDHATRLATGAFERLPLPDRVSRAVISALVGRTHARLSRIGGGGDAAFAAAMRDHPIAEHADLANSQHYELPPAFFAAMLGPQRKYSCCLYETATATLAEAEEAALAATADHAGLANGQRILELGCGWGSLSLWMAQRFPAARIVSVSNSVGQRLHIEAEVLRRGLRNLDIVTADMNAFDTGARFDRIVSVEMFEHMANWHMLLERARRWLEPDGALLLHVFSHAHAPYRFSRDDAGDWIARHFFSGGVMPSHALVRQFGGSFTVERQWRWDGRHYARTATDWLARYDRNAAQIRPLLRQVYGEAAPLWHRRWRLFLLATEQLFGHRGGTAWGVSHALLRPVA